MESHIPGELFGGQPDGLDAGRVSRVHVVSDRIALAASALLCGALAFLALNEPLVADDFTNAIILREHPGLWEYLSYWYTTWTGRFSSQAFYWAALQARAAYGILIWLGLLALVVMTYALAKGRLPHARRSDLYATGFVLVSYWFGMPALEETVFWATGSVVYLWPAVATLILLYQYRRWELGCAARGPRGPRGMWAAASVVAMLLLGVWVGAAQEQLLVAAALFIAVFVVRAARAGRLRDVPAYLYSGAVGLVVAGAISLAAPGNAVRAAAIPSPGLWPTVFASGKYIVRIMTDWLPPLSPWLLCLALLALLTVRYPEREEGASATPSASRSDWWVWTLLGAATLSPFLVQPAFGAERTIMFLAVFLAVAMLSVGGGSSPEEVVRRPVALVVSLALCLMLLSAAADVGLSGWQAWRLRRGQLRRAEYIAAQKAGGILDVTVSPLSANAPRRGVIWNDGTADPDFWVNGLMAGWYGVDSVVVDGAPESDTGP